jgi:eukaryotic translation initiation factor 2C
MIASHLSIFAKHNNGDYPDRILIFRDGISEGQYLPVLTYEYDAVLKACQRIKGGYRPKILICVCAKRHSTRFFGEPRDIDSSGNLTSGLVVDRAVTHPYTFDFFMQSHQGRVGTARPTHYVCLLDEIGVTPDQLQKMVHSLCFTFARCTKSVSLVPVCYIAGESSSQLPVVTDDTS